jgi:hypothetical protein
MDLAGSIMDLLIMDLPKEDHSRLSPEGTGIQWRDLGKYPFFNFSGNAPMCE